MLYYNINININYKIIFTKKLIILFLNELIVLIKKNIHKMEESPLILSIKLQINLKEKIEQAVLDNNYVEIIKLLEKYQKNPTLVDDTIMFACIHGQLVIVKQIIDTHIDVIRRRIIDDKYKYLCVSDVTMLNSLLLAIDHDKTEIVKYLTDELEFKLNIFCVKYAFIWGKDGRASRNYYECIDQKDNYIFNAITLFEQICIKACVKHNIYSNLFYNICLCINSAIGILSSNLCYKILTILCDRYSDNEQVYQTLRELLREICPSICKNALYHCINTNTVEYFQQIFELNIITEVDEDDIIYLFRRANGHEELCAIFVSLFPKLFQKICNFFVIIHNLSINDFHKQVGIANFWCSCCYSPGHYFTCVKCKTHFESTECVLQSTESFSCLKCKNDFICIESTECAGCAGCAECAECTECVICDTCTLHNYDLEDRKYCNICILYKKCSQWQKKFTCKDCMMKFLCKGCDTEHNTYVEYVNDHVTVMRCVTCMETVLTQLDECCICWNKKITLEYHELNPCRHKVCYNCSSKISKCPLCRAQINSV